MTDIMVDIETLSTGTRAAILSIGAVMFDPIRGVEAAPEGFYKTIRRDTLVGEMDESAWRWWLQQDAAFEVFTDYENAASHETAIREFVEWCEFVRGEIYGLTFWCKGAKMDAACLEWAITQLGLEVPWKYNRVMCYRSLENVCRRKGIFPPYPENANLHHALSDAIAQAKHVTKLVAALGGQP